MKEPPILFSVPMVRALLDGRKTQTRRMLDGWTDDPPAYVEDGVITALDENDRPYRWPHTHAVGDLLWVREPWWVPAWMDEFSPAELPIGGLIYRQTDPKPADAGRSRQARFMCRWMSRLTLVVTDVRVQRLQEIRAAECRAEGAIDEEWDEWREDASSIGMPGGSRVEDERDVFEHLWNSIHGLGAWAANPWVAAYTFRVIIANIDRALADPAEHGLPPGYGR